MPKVLGRSALANKSRGICDSLQGVDSESSRARQPRSPREDGSLDFAAKPLQSHHLQTIKLKNSSRPDKIRPCAPSVLPRL